MAVSEFFNYKLKREDIELLQRLDKTGTHDVLSEALTHKLSKGEIELREVCKLFAYKEPITSIGELLEKYAFWEPSFSKPTRTFEFGYPVPVDVFYLFRHEAKQFFYNDIIVKGVNPYVGYGKWKH